MDETPDRKRPNERYPLSEKKTGDEELVFYYSRERRLAKAPPSVQALYAEVPKKKRFGFFRSLTATRPLAMLFASIIILCAAIVILSVFNAGGAYMLGGNALTVSALKFQGETIVVMNKAVRDDGNAYTGLVDIGVSPAVPEGSEAGDYPVFTHRIFFSLNPQEEYRFSLPFEADELLVVLQGERDMAQFKIKTK
jgi:hypothetical protein